MRMLETRRKIDRMREQVVEMKSFQLNVERYLRFTENKLHEKHLYLITCTIRNEINPCFDVVEVITNVKWTKIRILPFNMMI